MSHDRALLIVQLISTGLMASVIAACSTAQRVPSSEDPLLGKNLRGRDLRPFALIDVNLSGADLTEASLRASSLLTADLRGAKFSHTLFDGEDSDFPDFNSKPERVPVDVETVVEYFKGKMGGIFEDTRIRPKPGTELFFEWSPKRHKSIVTVPLNEENRMATQDMLALNVDRLNSIAGGRDLMEAKTRYYGNLHYDEKHQQYVRPYFYLNSWDDLFHPPVKNVSEPLARYYKRFTPIAEYKLNETYFDPAFQRNIDRASNTELTAGNKLELLLNSTAFHEKLRLINESKSYLWATSLAFFCDSSTMKLVDAMGEAVKRGVDVRVIAERILQPFTLGCYRKMRARGVQVMIRANTVQKGGWKGVFHAKVWIRDGEEAIVGGQNLLQPQNYATGFNYRSRDTDMLVRGPIVTDLLEDFVDFWRIRRNWRNADVKGYDEIIAGKKEQERVLGLRGTENYERWLSDPNLKTTGLCRSATQFAGASREPIMEILARHFLAAKDWVIYTTPGVDRPANRDGSSFIDEMQRIASWNKVQIDVITNGFVGGNAELGSILNDFYEYALGKGHSFIAKLIANAQYREQLKPAKRTREDLLKLAKSDHMSVFQYFQYIHAKEFLFDRTVASIGSWNMDIFSSLKSVETQVFCMDENLRNQLEMSLARDLANSIPLVVPPEQ